ncbi:hypothetical protein [Pelagibacterium sp. H642]|uniref:hypothetical protein n=1 Tax=Pelagibacterium sp. H642 TaxID=1881069 RepID=UPI002815A360|nr:hypothetical protein [Pelagibacterium sp. H642]WMT90961.1 hypothetical protein NO934_01515 [Pelagibacterium sp. H642]
MGNDMSSLERERLLAEIRPLQEEMRTLKAGQKKRRREVRLALATLYADADDAGAFVGQDEPSYHAKKDKEVLAEAQTRVHTRMLTEARRRAAATTAALASR